MLSLEHVKQSSFQRLQTFVLWTLFPGENANRWGQVHSLAVPVLWRLPSPRRTCPIMATDSGWSCLRLCSPEGLTSTSSGSLAWIWFILSCPCNAAANPDRGTQVLLTREQLAKHTLSLAWRAGRQYNYSHFERCIVLNCPFRTTSPISLVPVPFFQSLW